MSIKRLAWLLLTLLVSAFIVFNFENWLADKGLNNIFSDAERAVRDMNSPLASDGLWSLINSFMISDFMLGFVVGSAIFAFWDPVQRVVTKRWKFGQSSLPVNQSIVPAGLKLQMAPKHDEIDVIIIAQIKNQTSLKAEISLLDWDCEISGIKPKNRNTSGVSAAFLGGTTQDIRIPAITVPTLNSSVSGTLSMSICFGDKRDDPSSVMSFKYEFQFEDYTKSDLSPGHKMVDYLNHRLADLTYGDRKAVKRLEDLKRLSLPSTVEKQQ